MPVNIDKRLGETPLETLNRLRKEQPQFANSKLAYAGRLDPMATGELLVLVDEECKNRDHYQNLDKVYEFELGLGFSTDTGDCMGLIDSEIDKTILIDTNHDEQSLLSSLSISQSEVEGALNAVSGERQQDYPAYSSKTVDGVPLWKLAKKGELDSVEIPSHQVNIYDLQIMGSNSISINTLLSENEERLAKVNGSFRQNKILKQWQKKLSDYRYDYKLPLLKFKTEVSSGTYIRVLGEEIAHHLGTSGFCWNIHRTEVKT